MRRVSKLIQAFYYTGPYTGTVFPGAAALRDRMAPARRARDDAQRDTPSRAVALAAWRLLEIGMHRAGYDDFRLAEVLHPADGKPSWQRRSGAQVDFKVDFSLSHARGLALCVIAKALIVGCDVEQKQRIQARLTRRITHANAPRLPCWTELEAVVKAAGSGIMHGQDIEWTMGRDAIFNGVRWWCYPIDCGPEHAAHVAANAAEADVQIHRVTEL